MTVTIGIAAITGKFGRCIVDALLQRPEASIRGYCRDSSKVPLAFAASDRIEIVQGDAFDTTSLQSFVTGCNVVICCYNGDDSVMVEGQKLLIDACEKANVPRYVASDWALDYTKLEYGELFKKDPMKHVKDYLDSPERSVKGVHILIGGFMDTVFSPFFGIWDATSTTFNYWGTGNEIWEGTTYQNSAEYTASVALDSSAVGIQRFVGDKSTFFEITESFKKVYAIEPKFNNLGSLQDLFQLMHKRRAEQPQNFFSYLALFFQYYTLNGQTLIGENLDNSKYPEVEPVTWETFMKEVPLENLSTVYQDLATKGN